MPLQAQVFTSSGTFTFPTGVSAVWVDGTAAGSGGGAAFGEASGGGGGAGEAIYRKLLRGNPGSTITITIGAGGVAGFFNVTTYNGIIGPEHNISFSGVGGQLTDNNGSDTIIGPFTIKGGYGGGTGAAAGQGACGGGVGAWRQGGNPGASATNAGVRLGQGGPGYTSDRRSGNATNWAGAGSGAGSFQTGAGLNGGQGGSMGPWSGGAGGAGNGTTGTGGGGGGASRYGPGGAGGATGSSAPTVTTYGAGGGGSPANGSGTVNNGAAGGPGYVMITWYGPV